jgi:hypothetical protein
MFASAFERWEESKKYFMDKERVLTIYQFSETNFTDSSFDWEGDNDLLKLNFGGRNLDIKRCVLSKP